MQEWKSFTDLNEILGHRPIVEPEFCIDALAKDKTEADEEGIGRSHFLFPTWGVRPCEIPGKGVIKIQKSRGRGDQKTLEVQGEGVVEAKIQRRMYPRRRGVNSRGVTM